jgi:hypothetical protein
VRLLEVATFYSMFNLAPVGIDCNNSLFVRDEAWVAERLRTAPRRDVLGISL